ncbi:hypothetical protein [Nocardia sp. NPDC058480]|uniref:hypothetical protein n=1 Tax=unclassified Nocardia TaxID=2637762 RepID=UPI003665973B
MKVVGAGLLLALVGAITTSYSAVAGIVMLVIAAVVFAVGGVLVLRDPGGSRKSKRRWGVGTSAAGVSWFGDGGGQHHGGGGGGSSGKGGTGCGGGSGCGGGGCGGGGGGE